MKLSPPRDEVCFCYYCLLSRSFLAEATVWAKRGNKTLYARENGSNKTMASRACCLSLVRQLFHVGEIEAYSGDRKKKRSDEVSCVLKLIIGFAFEKKDNLFFRRG